MAVLRNDRGALSYPLFHVRQVKWFLHGPRSLVQ